MKKPQSCSKATTATTTAAMAAATTFATLARGVLGFRVTSNRQSSARAKRRHNSTAVAAATTTTTTAATLTSSCSAASTLPLLLLLLLPVAIISMHIVSVTAVGYSYTRFEGPVVGPEHLVTVQDEYGGGTRSDYVARPEYSFAYGVEDGKTRVLQNRKETRNGDEVQGVYSVVDPDGTLRVVKYTADDVHGFQAEVITNGVATLHGHGSNGSGGAAGAGGAAIQQEVEHADDNEVDEEEPDESHGKAPYKVHEDQAEEQDEEDGAEEESDHEEYEGSSEEGYEDAKTQSQQQTSSEEY